MFGMGMGEIILIAVVALLVLGPERLPGAAKAIGKGIRDLRAQTKDLTETIEQDTQIGDAVREIRGALRGDPETLYKKATGEDFIPKDDDKRRRKMTDASTGQLDAAKGEDDDEHEGVSPVGDAAKATGAPKTPSPPPIPNAAKPEAAGNSDSSSVIPDEFANTDDAWGEAPGNPHQEDAAAPDLPVIRTPAGAMARGESPPDTDSESESGNDPRHG
jgi:sec-independent protein translocase protein TatB